MKKTTETRIAETTKTNDLLEMYQSQTLVEGKHDAHIDGYTYGDYSDSCCC